MKRKPRFLSSPEDPNKKRGGQIQHKLHKRGQRLQFEDFLDKRGHHYGASAKILDFFYPLPPRVAHAALTFGVVSVEGTVFFRGRECQCQEGLEEDESKEHGLSYF